VFAYAGFINIIVQGLLLTQAGRFASERIIVVVAFASTGAGFFGLAIVSKIGLLAFFLTLSSSAQRLPEPLSRRNCQEASHSIVRA
jgi:hypothetical protein